MRLNESLIAYKPKDYRLSDAVLNSIAAPLHHVQEAIQQNVVDLKGFFHIRRWVTFDRCVFTKTKLFEFRLEVNSLARFCH